MTGGFIATAAVPVNAAQAPADVRQIQTVASICTTPYVPARVVQIATPTTPPIAKQYNITGIVTLTVQLDENSHVVGVPTIQSSPSNLLNAPAIEAAEQSTFKTKIANCQPTATEYTLSIEFNDNNNVQPAIPTPQPQLQTPSSQITPSPAAVCRTQQIEARYLLLDGSPAHVAEEVARHEADGSAQEAVHNGDGSVEAAIDGGSADDRVDIALCLVRLRHLSEARNLLMLTYRDFHGSAVTNGVVIVSKEEVAHQLALVEEKMGMHEAAVKHISLACRECEQKDDPPDLLALDPVQQDFRRIASEKVKAYAHQSAHQSMVESETSWANLTSDERAVVISRGGTRTNGKGYPDHIETYDAPGYHEEVWWYGCAYTFLNGKLTSTYCP